MSQNRQLPGLQRQRWAAQAPAALRVLQTRTHSERQHVGCLQSCELVLITMLLLQCLCALPLQYRQLLLWQQRSQQQHAAWVA
jgi:hypothetical protein